MTETKQDAKSPIIPAISAVVLIIAVAVSLASSSSISREAFLLLSSGLFLSALVLFVGLLYKPLAHYSSSTRSTKRQDRIAQKLIGELESYVEGFGSINNAQRLDSIVYPLANLGSRAEFSKVPSL